MSLDLFRRLMDRWLIHRLRLRARRDLAPLPPIIRQPPKPADRKPFRPDPEAEFRRSQLL